MIVFALSTGHKLGLGLVGLAFIVFALTSAMVIPRFRPGFPGRNLTAFVAVTFCFFAAMLFAVFYFGRESKPSGETAGAPTAAAATTTAATAPAPGGAKLADGKKVFTTAGCSGCHTLKDAGASGTTGPNLDRLKPSAARVVKQVTNGGKIMPSFKASLSAQQIQDVAAYVASAAGKA